MMRRGRRGQSGGGVLMRTSILKPPESADLEDPASSEAVMLTSLSCRRGARPPETSDPPHPPALESHI